MAARLAKIMIEQWEVRKQKEAQYAEMAGKDGGSGFSQQLKSELNHTAHLVGLEDAVVKTYSGEDRYTQIGKLAADFLEKMGMPREAQYTDGRQMAEAMLIDFLQHKSPSV